MLDPVSILAAVATAALLAAALAWPWRGAAGAAAVAAGFFAGAWVLGSVPAFPPREDLGRWLLVLLPASLAAELLAAAARRPWQAWTPRLLVAAAATPTLLYGSVYLTDAGGPGTREWPPATAAAVLAGLGAALAGAWALLDRHAARAGGRAALAALATAAAGAALTVLLSGYATGGLLGLPLAAALAGAAAVGARGGAVGFGVVGLFALLAVGRFFGSLTTANAVLLFAAPLLVTLPQLVPARRERPRLRAAAGLALAAVPVAVAVTFAVQKFAADTARPSAAADSGPSVGDYASFGK